MKTKDNDNLSMCGKALKNQMPVILSGAKDLRSYPGLNDSRATAEILRCAQSL